MTATAIAAKWFSTASSLVKLILSPRNWGANSFRAFVREALQSGGALIATDAKDGRVIGSSRFHGYNARRGEVEIGWTFLPRSYWGGRYNREMKWLMLRHAFRVVERVVFLVGRKNIRSLRALEKIGTVRAESRLDGSGHDSIVYQISPIMFEPEQWN
jgi:RimJ/RimL family protein N-acetyltransferase